MNRVLLFQLDGKLPNLALMRIAAHHRALGDEAEFRWTDQPERTLWDGEPDRVYGSLIFERTRPAADRLLSQYPGAILGGTGWDISDSLEAHSITTTALDFSLYPEFRQSIGFTQRGCRFRCAFCVVPRKEGRIREEQTIADIWRGDPWPRELVLLDNDFFGQPHWQERIAEIRDGGFRVSLCQGINARLITDEQAEALASVDYRSVNMKERRIYTAWDNPADERRFVAGFERLVKAGIKPDHVMVYMILGFQENDQREHRRALIRSLGADPYPIPFERTTDAVGFQRWVCGAYDKRIPWADWSAAGYRPENLAGGIA